ncbi:MAG: hypothetical protein M3395_01165 [Chloroflexota bacterium]|nr:hypothetical protein [Chloroflexota bacterium]
MSAVEALLRISYPLATIQGRGVRRPRGGPSSWEIFRDDLVLDHELLRRARAGELTSAGQLYDRHHRLAYGIALSTSGRRDVAAGALIAGFRALMVDPTPAGDVRVRLAAVARETALQSRFPGDPPDTEKDDLTNDERMAVGLARAGLVGEAIAVVMRVDVPEVRRLVNHGLKVMARWGRGSGARHRPDVSERLG